MDFVFNILVGFIAVVFVFSEFVNSSAKGSELRYQRLPPHPSIRLLERMQSIHLYSAVRDGNDCFSV